MPLCHSGIQPAGLPLPLNLLQAASLNDLSSLERALNSLSLVLHSDVPRVDFTQFISAVKDFEARYTFWNRVNSEFHFLRQFLNKDFNIFLKDGKIDLQLTETIEFTVEKECLYLLSNSIIIMEQTGGSSLSPSGVYGGYTISLTDLGKKLVKHDRFLK